MHNGSIALVISFASLVVSIASAGWTAWRADRVRVTVVPRRVVRPMLGLKSFACARVLIAGIEKMHMIRKGQLERLKERGSSAADQFYSLAF